LPKAGYDPVAEVLFNELKVDGYFLEFDTARAGNFAPLRYMPKDKKLILGLGDDEDWDARKSRRSQTAHR
jgi:5-methyltetrahydropteroyltriglutamate--homocysteine methyltransferase